MSKFRVSSINLFSTTLNHDNNNYIDDRKGNEKKRENDWFDTQTIICPYKFSNKISNYDHFDNDMKDEICIIL